MTEHDTPARQAIDDDFLNAYKLVAELEQYQQFPPDDEDGDTAEEEKFTEIQLERNLVRLELRLQAALESKGLRSVAKRLRQWSKSSKAPTRLTMLPFVGELVCPHLGQLDTFRDILDPYLPATSSSTTDRSRLKSVLLGTPTMIRDRDLEPSNEADVQRVVHDVIKHLYPGAHREVPIAKTFKKYKPDIGIPSLKTAVEYKFFTTADEFKAHLGGVFEDVHGYAGSEDWKYFFGVLYVTEAFYTPAELQEELSRSKIPDNWDLFMVTGRGARKKKEKSRA